MIYPIEVHLVLGKYELPLFFKIIFGSLFLTGGGGGALSISLPT